MAVMKVLYYLLTIIKFIMTNSILMTLHEVIGSSDVRNWNNKRGCLKLSVPEWRKWFKMTWLQISRVGYRDRNRAHLLGSNSSNQQHDMPYRHHDHNQQQHPHYHHHGHPHHHQQQHHQHQKFGHSDCQDKPTTSYVILYPYSPPNLGDGDTQNDNNNESNHDTKEEEEEEDKNNRKSEENPQTSQHNNPQPSKVMEVPVVYRDYNTVETHYSEEPLSNLDPKFHPVMHEILNSNPLCPSTHASPLPGDHGEGGRNESESQKGEHSDGDGGKDNEGGLVGDLAKMSMSDPNIVTMGDRERRLQWEHGQADYLGIDRFDNIRARLDSKINETGNTKTMITDGNNSSSSSSK